MISKYVFMLQEGKGSFTPCDLVTLNKWLLSSDITAIVYDEKDLIQVCDEHKICEDIRLSFVGLKWHLGLNRLITPYDYNRYLIIHPIKVSLYVHVPDLDKKQGLS